MNTKVISLVSATNRRQYIQEFLQNQSINFDFVDAIEGTQLTPVPYRLHQNAVACFHSHRQLLEWASAQNETTLILEDDAYSTKSVLEEIEKILETETLWDIIFLGWKSKARVEEVDDKLVKSSHFILAHAYLVNPIGAKRILTFLGEPDDHIDMRISELGRKNIVRVLLVKDKIFTQKGFETQIPKIKNNKTR